MTLKIPKSLWPEINSALLGNSFAIFQIDPTTIEMKKYSFYSQENYEESLIRYLSCYHPEILGEELRCTTQSLKIRIDYKG